VAKYNTKAVQDVADRRIGEEKGLPYLKAKLTVYWEFLVVVYENGQWAAFKAEPSHEDAEIGFLEDDRMGWISMGAMVAAGLVTKEEEEAEREAQFSASEKEMDRLDILRGAPEAHKDKERLQELEKECDAIRKKYGGYTFPIKPRKE